jgi:putative tricarboxylic transport membrane protein
MLEGVFWIGVGFAISLLAWTSGLGSFHEPGQGFVAFVSGIFLCSIGTIMVISEAFSKSQLKSRSDILHAFRGIPWTRLTFSIGLILGYLFVLNSLGYILSTFLLMYGMFYDWEKKSWFSSLLFSIVTAGSSYLVFEVWLQCQLPRGIFPWR